MDLIKKEKQWFLSDEGKMSFDSLSSAGDRVIFIYSYLMTFAGEKFKEDNVLFKTAFLLADAVFNSTLEYSTYPNLVDEKVNPFVAFLSNAKREHLKKYTLEQIYCIFLSIIHNIADPFNKSEWIYDNTILNENGHIDKTFDAGHMFVVPNKKYFINPEHYACEEKYNMIQLEIIWLFGEK